MLVFFIFCGCFKSEIQKIIATLSNTHLYIAIGRKSVRSPLYFIPKMDFKSRQKNRRSKPFLTSDNVFTKVVLVVSQRHLKKITQMGISKSVLIFNCHLVRF